MVRRDLSLVVPTNEQLAGSFSAGRVSRGGHVTPELIGRRVERPPMHTTDGGERR